MKVTWKLMMDSQPHKVICFFVASRPMKVQEVDKSALKPTTTTANVRAIPFTFKGTLE